MKRHRWKPEDRSTRRCADCGTLRREATHRELHMNFRTGAMRGRDVKVRTYSRDGGSTWKVEKRVPACGAASC